MPLPTLAEFKRASWKTIGIRDGLLGHIDRTLTAYHAAPAGTEERSALLADLLLATVRWMKANPASSRMAGVRRLRDDIEAELANPIWVFQLTSVGDGSAPVRRLRVRLVSVGQFQRDPAADVARASDIWRQAGIEVMSALGGAAQVMAVHPGPDRPPRDLSGVPTSFRLNAEHRLLGVYEQDLVEYSRRMAPAIFTVVCYAPLIGGDGVVFGKTERPGAAPGQNLVVPIVKVAARIAKPETLAHELGHVLLNDGSHHASPDNLMADSAVRKGTHLTARQIFAARASRWVQ